LAGKKGVYVIMNILPLWAIFAGTIVIVLFAVEAGYRVGRAVHRRKEDEKESPVSAIASLTLSLTAFILAFSFGMVGDRYDARRALVREEANAIRTAYLRSVFLEEPDRAKSALLLREYVGMRLAAAKSKDLGHIGTILTQTENIQKQLWDMAVVNARRDLNSDIGALYIESLNAVIDIHALRLTMGLQSRLPFGIWAVLYVLVILGMIAIGYQTGIADSRRSWTMLILTLSFSIVIVMIAALDRPVTGYFQASQQPLLNLQASMAAGLKTDPGTKDKP
jgi:hypothetical protein